MYIFMHLSLISGRSNKGRLLCVAYSVYRLLAGLCLVTLFTCEKAINALTRSPENAISSHYAPFSLMKTYDAFLRRTIFSGVLSCFRCRLVGQAVAVKQRASRRLFMEMFQSDDAMARESNRHRQTTGFDDSVETSEVMDP